MTRQEFRSRLSVAQPLLCPGICDALSAALVAQADFEAAYLSGAVLERGSRYDAKAQGRRT